MASEEERRLPREFYPGIVSLGKAAKEFNIPQQAIDDMLDEVEEDILDGLDQAEEKEENSESEE